MWRLSSGATPWALGSRNWPADHWHDRCSGHWVSRSDDIDSERTEWAFGGKEGRAQARDSWPGGLLSLVP